MSDPMMALSVDNAVYLFGNALQHELDEIDNGKGKPEAKKRKKERTLAKWLGLEQKFRNPGA